MTNSTGSPALRGPRGGGHRERRVVGRRDDDRVRGLPAARPPGSASIARAQRERVGAASTSRRLQAAGRATSPTRMICAPPAAFEPVGASALRAVLAAPGSDVPSVTGSARRSARRIAPRPAIPTRQSPLVDERHGLRARRRPGNTAARRAAAFADRRPRRPRASCSSWRTPGTRAAAPPASSVALRADRRLRCALWPLSSPPLPRRRPRAGGSRTSGAGTATIARGVASATERWRSAFTIERPSVYSGRRSMDFRLTDDQIAFQRHCHAFAARRHAPGAARYDREQSVPLRRHPRGARARACTGSPARADRRRRDGDHERDLRRGAALGLRRHRAGDLRARRSRPPASPRRARPSRSAAGSRRASAWATRSASAPTRSPRPGAGSDVRSLRTTARARRRRVGPQRHQGLHLQRRHRRRQRRRRDRRPRARPPRPGVVHRREGHARLRAWARRRTSSASARRRPPSSSSRTCRVPMENLLGGLDKLERKLERARSGERSRSSGALATFEITRPLVGASALGIARAAYEWTLDRLEGKRRRARPAARAAARPAGARRRGDRDRRRAPARAARRVDGPQRRPDDRRPGLDEQAEGGRRRDVGDDGADGPRRPRGGADRPPAREVVPRREDLPAVRGHGPGPAARDLAHAGGRAPAAVAAEAEAAGGRRRRRGARGRRAARRRAAQPLSRAPNVPISAAVHSTSGQMDDPHFWGFRSGVPAIVRYLACNAESPDGPGNGGPRLFGANLVVFRGRRRLFPRQPVS